MAGIPKPKRSTTKATKSKCVALSGKIVTLQGVCLRCGRHCECDPHHIVPRSHDRTAARIDNQMPLCRACHSYAHANPNAFKNYFDSLYPGRRLMLEAVARSQPGISMDWVKVYTELVDEAKIKGIM